MTDRYHISAYPTIFLAHGGKSFPYRCPLCFSNEYHNELMFVDEDHTFAVYPPRISNLLSTSYRYQIYKTLVCDNCQYRYHFRPRGQWTKVPFAGKQKRILERVSGLPLEIGKWQDYRLLKLAEARRYSSYDLNPVITSSKISLLTGAGFSAPLGFPTMGGFLHLIPQEILDKLRSWLCPDSDPKRRHFYDAVFNDVETTMDFLFRLQRIAALIPDEYSFVSGKQGTSTAAAHDALRCVHGKQSNHPSTISSIRRSAAANG
jgi:hypothetical protein